MNTVNRTHSRFTAVIDDDPTGIQTVHGVNVYLDHSLNMLLDAVKHHRLFFIQTNSRGMIEEQAVKINALIMERLVYAAQRTGKDFSIISRSDSTLRGHYPKETQALKDTYEKLTGNHIDGEILIPFFLEAERITIGDVHYVQEGESLVPVGKTEFAHDNTFGYKNSNLKKYISEKHHGTVRTEEVISISLEDIRCGTDAVYEKLMIMSNFRKMIVNAVTYDDLDIMVEALNQAEAAGKRFIYRTASSFVRAYGKIKPKPLLSAEEMCEEGVKLPGIVVAGSHVKKTTLQLQKLFTLPVVVPIEISVQALLKDEMARGNEIKRCTLAINDALYQKKIPVLFTSRNVITSSDGNGEKNLELATTISLGIVQVVRNIGIRPGFIITKGGITSSDIASKALDIKKVLALGQIRSGVPVVRCGNESRWPGMPYVIFPGNVGTEEDLKATVMMFIEKE